MWHKNNKNAQLEVLKPKSCVMKPIFFFILMLGLAVACSTPKNTSKDNKTGDELTIVDSTEYDVETFDRKFDVWYQHYQNPAMYKTQAYYESWNKQYVSAWNAKCVRGGKTWPFEPVVGYNNDEDYGFEMNHKLFYYFMYVENVLKIKVLPGGPTTY